MKFGKESVGVFIEGSTLRNPTQQSAEIVQLAVRLGLDLNMEQWGEDYGKIVANDLDDWSYEDFENLDWLVEDAMYFLNANCTDDGYAFTFRDTDFVLIGVEDDEA